MNKLNHVTPECGSSLDLVISSFNTAKAAESKMQLSLSLLPLSSSTTATECVHYPNTLWSPSSHSSIISLDYCMIKWLIEGTDHPSLSAAFTLTPKSSRNLTMWWWPAQTALWRGVMPSSLGILGFSTLKMRKHAYNRLIRKIGCPQKQWKNPPKRPHLYQLWETLNLSPRGELYRRAKFLNSQQNSGYSMEVVELSLTASGYKIKACSGCEARECFLESIS